MGKFMIKVIFFYVIKGYLCVVGIIIIDKYFIVF